MKTVCVSLEPTRTCAIKRRHEEFGVMRGSLKHPGAEISAIDTILARMNNKESKELMYLVA